MLPAYISKSDDSSFLALVLQVLGVEKPEGTLSLPVDLIINGQLPIRIFQLKRRWFIRGIIAREVSQCEEDALPFLVERASGMWGTLEGNFSYEQSEDTLILWKELSDLKDQKELEPVINCFLAELEFWRMEAAHAGCGGKEIFP